MESVKEANTFLKHAAKLAKKKPVVLIKSGRSKAGQKAASSHTGAMSVDDTIFSVACKKTNMIRVTTIESFFDMAKLLSKLKKVNGFKLGVVTNAGGPGVIVADAAEANNFILPTFTEKTINIVKEINPHPSNPLDLIGDAKPTDYKTAVKTLQADKNIDIVYALLTPQSMTNPERVADVLVSLNKSKPVIASFIGGTSVSHPRRYLKEHGVADFETPERGIKALARLFEYTKRKQVKKNFEQKTILKKETFKYTNGKKQLTMEESFKLLHAFGINTPKTIFLTHANELENHKITFPVVLKTATGLAHKTDHDLIKVGIHTKEELEEELHKMHEKSKQLGIETRFAIQEMIKGQEVLISIINTEFGKVVTYGLGGIFVEVTKDFSQKITPINDSDIEEMLSEVKGTKVLYGERTKKKYDVESLKKLIKALVVLAQTYPQIIEIELNPVIVTENSSVAVDAIMLI